MNWTYSLERLPSKSGLNRHTVQVASEARDPRERITIKLWTNLEAHAVDVTAHDPIVLYAEVKLGHAPIVGANVVAEIHAINQTGHIIPSFDILLLDSGNGDPDLRSQDGIYSRYLTTFPGGEGRYTINLRVDDNHGKAFAPLKTYGDVSRACCQDKTYLKISNQKLGTFSRIVKGDSFRIHSIVKGPLPPSRIMNLGVTVLTASQELEFSWTTPGDDYDSGRPTSYQLFYSDAPNAFYKNKRKIQMVESFSAAKNAGVKVTRKIFVDKFDKNLHYALLAVDKDGNVGDISNVVKAYMPRPVPLEDPMKASPHSSGGVSVSTPAEKPSKILLYLIVGIVGFIILCMMVVMIILLSFRRKKLPEDISVDSKGMSGSSTDNNGFSVVGDDMESSSRDGEAKHFLLSSSGQDSMGTNGPTHSSPYDGRDESSSVCDNPYGYIGGNHHNNQSYGWTPATNPYVYKDQNETYASIGSYQNTSQDSYVRGYQPTYAQPIPKNLRPQHIYSNAAIIARNSPLSHQHHQLTTPQGSMDRQGTVTFVAQTETPILRVSPDSQHSSENAPTPTKSILKKPKDTTLDTTDRDSQSSHASSVNAKDHEVRSPSATDTVSSQQSHVSTVTTNEDVNLSIEKTYLETSFEFAPVMSQLTEEESENASNLTLNSGQTPSKKGAMAPPPTLPKPRPLGSNEDIIASSDNLQNNLSNSLDKKIRNCTQV